MMKRCSPLQLIAGAVFLTSCAAVPSKYSFTPSTTDGHTMAVVAAPAAWRDDGLCFVLTNNGDKPLLIDWDRSYLVLEDHTVRCIHAGVYLKDKTAPQAPSPVAPGSALSDCLYPVDNITIDDDPISFMSQGWRAPVGGGVKLAPLGVSTGGYSIAIECEGKKERIQGTFSFK